MCRVRAVPILLLSLLCGCAPAVVTACAPDEARGLKLLEENSGHPGVDNLTDAEIQTFLQDNVGRDGHADGLVVGIVDASGTRVIGAGTTGGPAGKPVDGDTIFRIGSITKVFTAILLQDMVDRGEMNLDDPVQNYLPASVRLPTRNGRAITLFDLATHTSGLPRDWSDLGPSPGTIEGRYVALSGYKLSRDPGKGYEYSNMGVALLAHVIALRTGKDYESLIKVRICEPLEMRSTCITITPPLRVNLATGHAFPGRVVADPGTSLFPGAGEICTTANDLLKFVSANLELAPSPLSRLLKRAHSSQVTPSGRRGRLVWEENGGVIQHGGAVDGFRSNVGFDPARPRGAVILANCSTSRMPPALLPVLLNNRSARPSQAVPLDSMDLEKYIGIYRFPGKTSLFVRREGNRLLFQTWRGEPRYPMPHITFEAFPQSGTVFYNAMWDSRITFHGEKLVLNNPRENIKNAVANRISTRLPEPLPEAPDPASYSGLVGQYRPALFGLIPFGPTLNVYCTQDALGTHLNAYVVGMAENLEGELFVYTPQAVFNPGLENASLGFRLSRTGRAGGVVVRIGGNEIQGVRTSDHPITPPREN